MTIALNIISQLFFFSILIIEFAIYFYASDFAISREYVIASLENDLFPIINLLLKTTDILIARQFNGRRTRR